MNSARKIALIASDLARGGVADHVTTLAAALAAKGVFVQTYSRETGSDHNLIDIDWVGLHFVSYGWAPRGILRRRDIEELHHICAGRRVAVYLHELWIGEAVGASIKHRLIGAMQRRRLLQLIAQLHPAQIFTNTPAYQAILNKEHISAKVLPLPGNLPIPSAADRREARTWLDAAGINMDGRGKLAAIFGTIHPEWDGGPAIANLLSHQKRQGDQTVLLTLGRHGPCGSERLAALRKAVPDLICIHAGEQPAPLLAGLLAECSLGIATSPWALIGKSGTAAAFLEAGLPVLVTRNDWQWRRGPTPPPRAHPLLALWTNDSGFSWTEFLARRQPPASTLPDIAGVWIELLQSSEGNCG